jgi:hypothetical protein
MKKVLSILFLLAHISVFSQTVNTPNPISFLQNVSNQVAGTFSVSGFSSSSTLLITVGLINPPAGTTLRFNVTSGVTASTGYSLTPNFTRISFTGTQANVNSVLSSLRVNTGTNPGNIYIAVTATVNPAGYFYLPTNGHFYRPISSGATYTNSRAAALNTTFKGQQGYLVTITSADEDAFIFNNVPQSQIWFALTDEVVEGRWVIDAGPERGTVIKTSNGQFAGNIAGQYNNWAPGEPNNSGNEDYAVTKWNGSQWNDLPNNFSCPYVIEYGTWTDPANQTFTDFYSGFVTHQISCTQAQTPSPPVPIDGRSEAPGSVTISTNVPSGITVDWYSSPSGGNPISIGSTSFNTPLISTTTYYYAQARNLATGCFSSTRSKVVAAIGVSEKIKGTVKLPLNLQETPHFKLIRIEGSNQITVDSTFIDSNGEFSLQPDMHNSLYRIIPSFSYSLDSTDFVRVFLESQNLFSPSTVQIGQYLITGANLKAGDVDSDGRVDINDAYLVLSSLTSLNLLNRVYWYESSEFINMTPVNFNQIPEFNFLVNFQTSEVFLDLRFICAGDTDLSTSGN